MTAGPKALSHKDMGGLKVTAMADGSASTDAVTKSQLDTTYTNAISRANHTGSQASTTISDFDTQVRTSTLNQMTAPTADLSINTHKLTSVTDPTNPQDAATKAYVDAATASLTSGLVLKGSVRAVVGTNVSITAAPATLDGLTPTAGQVFLLTGQTAGAENGPRIWNSAGAAMPRASNFDSSGEAVLGSFWDVREGTSADTFALMTNDAAITLDTTALTFVIRGGSSGAATGFTATCPGVSAGATWTVTHNLGSKFVLAQVARVASPYDIVDVRIERTTTNTLSVMPDVALTSGDFEVMVQKVA